MRRRLEPAGGRLDLVGRDLARRGTPAGRRRRLLGLALAIFLPAALAVAALRIDLIRVRYGLADALHEEKALLEEQRKARAELGARRDPARLARLAPRHGLVRPRRIIDLPAAPAETGRP